MTCAVDGCENDPVVWPGGGADGRCEDHPIDTCQRCGGELDLDEQEVWETKHRDWRNCDGRGDGFESVDRFQSNGAGSYPLDETVLKEHPQSEEIKFTCSRDGCDNTGKATRYYGRNNYQRCRNCYRVTTIVG
jgi:hypothetical protein